MSEYDVPISLPVKYDIDYDDTAGIDCDQSPADVASFVIPHKCEVVEAGALVTEACAGATTTPVVDFDLRPTGGSDTGRGAADIAHLVLATTAQGKVMYDLVGQGTILYPGQEVVVQLLTQATGTGAAGHIKPYLTVKYIPEIRANLTGLTLTA
ncbi:MAG: hypothetical protein HGJ94_14040 [Desulfosarcina sp.]|nr:hypothetical protein [Desulfosarcina sp.]MBC2741548.1 hypothetical protein [Desulfosarcina sp.]MBC2764462.1 hypothetical protein [Desulfosarcina sp.]